MREKEKFKERKIRGNRSERLFHYQYPEAIRTSSFVEDDFETRTSDMEKKVKYMPDFKLNGKYVEVKSSNLYNQAEYDYHITAYPDMYVFVIDKLYKLNQIVIKGPFPGSRFASGLSYYRMDLS